MSIGVLSSDTNIQIVNNCQAIISDCKRILEFDEAMVRVDTATLAVTVFGQNLYVNDYISGGIVIMGTISNIELRALKSEAK